MCSRGSIKTVAGLFLLMSLLPGCGNNSNNISISSNAVSINNASIEASVEANIEASVSDNEVADEAGDNTAISDSSSLNAVSDAVDIKNAKPGDIIVLGEYEQDGDQGKDPIEWIVLDEYEDTILVLSRYIIEKKAFNDTDTAVYWSQSTLRTWLNEDFINEAFSDSEKELIVTSTLNNPGSSQYFAEFGKSGGTATGNNTADRVFLLSFDDVLKYYDPVKVEKYYVYASPELICQATPASGIENVSMDELEYRMFYEEEGWPEECLNESGAGWFLRSHGINGDDVMSVGYDGGVRGYYFQIGADFENVTFEGGVRPAMWIYK